MAISINFLSNTREFLKGTQDVEQRLEDVSSALDDVAHDSQRSARKMEGDYKDAARAVDQSNERLERSFRELADSSRQSTKQVGDDLERNVRTSSAHAGESVREFGNEAKQNIAETFSSFRGDASDFAQIVQDTLGGLASGFSGIPAVAAVAAGAAGIGLVMGALDQANTKSEAWKQEVSELTQQFIEVGREGPDALDAVVDKLKDLATQADAAGVDLKKLDDLSSRSRNSFEDVAQAYAGNSDALHDLVKSGERHAEQLEKQINRTDANNDASRKMYGTLVEQAQAQNELNDYLGDAAKKADEAAHNAELYAASGADAMKAKAEQIRSIDDAYDEAAGAASDYVNAENGMFDVDKYISAMQEKAAALDSFKDNMQEAALTLSPSAQTFLQSQGQEAAATLVSAYVNGTDAQRTQLAAIWNTAGQTSAGSYVAALRNGIPPTMNGPRVVISDVDTSRIPGMIQQTLNGHRFEVPVYANPRVGRAVT